MRTIARARGHVWDDLHAEEPPDQEEIIADAVFYATFSTPEGQRALEYLHIMTTFNRSQPGASDGALREDEAKRRLVAIIEARIARHVKRKPDGGRTGRRTAGGTSGQRRSGRRDRQPS